MDPLTIVMWGWVALGVAIFFGAPIVEWLYLRRRQVRVGERKDRADDEIAKRR